MYKFEISAEAEKDLEDIALYISDYDVVYSLRFIDKLVSRFENLLSAYPKAGVLYKKKKNIRKITFQDYTAYYEFVEETETIYILHIINQTKPLEARGIDF